MIIVRTRRLLLNRDIYFFHTSDTLLQLLAGLIKYSDKI